MTLAATRQDDELLAWTGGVWVVSWDKGCGRALPPRRGGAARDFLRYSLALTTRSVAE